MQENTLRAHVTCLRQLTDCQRQEVLRLTVSVLAAALAGHSTAVAADLAAAQRLHPLAPELVWSGAEHLSALLRLLGDKTGTAYRHLVAGRDLHHSSSTPQTSTPQEGLFQ